MDKVQDKQRKALGQRTVGPASTKARGRAHPNRRGTIRPGFARLHDSNL